MIISLLRSISNQSVFSDTTYFTSEPSFTLVKGNLTMNRNPVLNSPDDITEDLLKRIINNDLDSLTINYEFAYTYNDEIESQKDRSEPLEKNPFIRANRIKALRRIEFEVILTPAVHSLSHAFENMYRLEYVNIKDTSNITDMSCMFQDDESFNQPLNDWDTSKVTDMSEMFYGCLVYNSPVSSWNTSNVTDMSDMFYDCCAFNQSLDTWDTSKVIKMSRMFHGCRAFNQPLDTWDTSKVADMSGMFMDAESFNQPVGSWNTSLVSDMTRMFKGAGTFNHPVGDWDTSRVIRMREMFRCAHSFNQPLDSWNTSHVTDMSFMFKGAVSFNQPLSSWNTSEVTSMTNMFYGAESFNQPLDGWDTSAVADMSHMFRMAKSFNQSVKCWNTASVRDFSGMFCGAVSFRQPIWENLDKRKVCHADFENNEGVLESVEKRLSEDYTLDVYIHEPLFIDEIINGKKAVTIRWSGCRGYGEYTICKNKDIDSEYMESDYDRSFAVSILKILRKEHQTENIKRHLGISCDLETFVLKECRISDYDDHFAWSDDSY